MRSGLVGRNLEGVGLGGKGGGRGLVRSLLFLLPAGPGPGPSSGNGTGPLRCKVARRSVPAYGEAG